MPTHLHNHLWFFSPSFKCCLNIPKPLKAIASVLCSAGVHTSFLVVTAVRNTVLKSNSQEAVRLDLFHPCSCSAVLPWLLHIPSRPGFILTEKDVFLASQASQFPPRAPHHLVSRETILSSLRRPSDDARTLICWMLGHETKMTWEDRRWSLRC